MLKPAIERTNLGRFQDIENSVLNGFSLLWLAVGDNKIVAAATTVIETCEHGRVCVLTACGGTDMKQWLSLLAGIEKYAHAENCMALRFFGRKGWTHALEGYDVTNIVMEKALI